MMAKPLTHNDKRRGYQTIEKLAKSSETLRRDLAKYAPVLMTYTFDLTQARVPQFNAAKDEFKFRQGQLPKLMRDTDDPEMTDVEFEEFEKGLRVVQMRAEGTPFLAIGKALWPMDQTPAGQKSKAWNWYHRVLNAHRAPRLAFVSFRSSKATPAPERQDKEEDDPPSQA